ncbi:MAG: TIM barrel protein [Candidatus Stahlbacteria bacterium]|nr:TIM barrel protein [Candidatus Stahlbacteria bacterium]
MASTLLFGTAGIPLSAIDRSTEVGIKEIKKLGLGCMEIEFVRGVYLSEIKAQAVKKVAATEGIALTVHAPYFINLSSSEAHKVIASKQRILASARIGAKAGAKSVTFHPAYYGNKRPKEVYKAVKDNLLEITTTLQSENIEIDIRPETTGKGTQFGTLDEIILLSQEVPMVKPCVDFSHVYARGVGNPNSYTEFMNLLERIETNLGQADIKDMHIHLSGIQYGNKGELKHLTIQDCPEFRYKELLQALSDKEVCGVLICESPNLEVDAIIFKQIYSAIQKADEPLAQKN